MKFSKKSILSTSLAVTLAAATIIGGGTYAYLHDSTEDVVNSFKANQVTVELTETPVNYNIIPGTTQVKDPTVKVSATVPAYVFVEVSDTTKGLVDYAIANGWTALDGVANVYYHEVEGSDEVQELHVLKDDKVSYSADLENEDMYSDYGTLLQGVNLTFKASAIQKEKFDTPLDAYFQNDSEDGIIRVSDSAGFISALQNADDGDIILLAAGNYAPTATNQWVLDAPNVTLIGAGAGETVLDAGGFSVWGQAGFYVQSDGVTIKNMTIKNGTATDYSNPKNVAALKVSPESGGTINSFTLENADIQSEKSHGISLHTLSNAVINNVTVSDVARVGLTMAQSKNVVVTNTTFAATGTYTPKCDICMTYSASYPEASSLIIGEGNNFGHGVIDSEKIDYNTVNLTDSGYEWEEDTFSLGSFYEQHTWTIVK